MNAMDPDCVCAYINTRHCPIHAQAGTAKPRDGWFPGWNWIAVMVCWALGVIVASLWHSHFAVFFGGAIFGIGIGRWIPSGRR